MATPKLEEICQIRLVNRYYDKTIGGITTRLNISPLLQYQNVGETDWIDIAIINVEVPPPESGSES